jgi:bifunctional non-homologous end joining protein LigD
LTRLAFIRPLSPSAAVRPPKGDDWLHEPKWDGFRFQVIKDGAGVRLYSKSGADYTDRLPTMVEAFGNLPTQSAILDGELVPYRSPGFRSFLPADVSDADELAG